MRQSVDVGPHELSSLWHGVSFDCSHERWVCWVGEEGGWQLSEIQLNIMKLLVHHDNSTISIQCRWVTPDNWIKKLIIIPSAASQQSEHCWLHCAMVFYQHQMIVSAPWFVMFVLIICKLLPNSSHQSWLSSLWCWCTIYKVLSLISPVQWSCIHSRFCIFAFHTTQRILYLMFAKRLAQSPL